MVNLIGEKFYHPYLKTEITVFDFDRGMLKAKIGSSEFTEWLTVNQRLEFYAEQQKQRADEAEKRADVADEKWERLKQKTAEKYKYLEGQFETWEHDENESKLWRTSKHEVLMILKDMSDIERGEE
ncbi:hypothetical protein ERX27_07540 [Macrococcus brunensis]|uniref:Uncharacterized protein n=1 Tax=Macrococcus brunensis TaxID=198483 RepID=A0A4R6BCW1_9STAP|nr:hypothetical protein [Macrococcus brunensis]TDL96699.1 hypothetical protein ERX27_07540 [Macrococcus brunensis]